MGSGNYGRREALFRPAFFLRCAEKHSGEDEMDDDQYGNDATNSDPRELGVSPIHSRSVARNGKDYEKHKDRSEPDRHAHGSQPCELID